MTRLARRLVPLTTRPRGIECCVRPLAAESHVFEDGCVRTRTMRARQAAAVCATAALLAGAAATASLDAEDTGCSDNGDVDTDAELLNYSGMKAAKPSILFTPANTSELAKLVRACHERGVTLRPVGRFLSPNGIAASGEGNGGCMVSLARCDAILDIDVDNLEVTVEGGALVGDIVTALADHGLTLANFSSISDQRVAGWTQVAAHGTGAALPTVDMMIKRMTLITPALGELELAPSGPFATLFRMASVGLGCLGVVSRLTLACTPAHALREHTMVLTGVDAVRAGHAMRLARHRHVRYMWIPHTDDVVVVTADPIDRDNLVTTALHHALERTLAENDEETDPRRPLQELLVAECAARGVSVPDAWTSLSFAGLRDCILDLDPTSLSLVKAANQAEAQFWRRHADLGPAVGPSPQVLGFECGGQQLVLEVCLPAGSARYPSGAGVDFVAELKARIEKRGMPVPAPIEHRWTAASQSYMSPAFSADPSDLFAWIGVITYLPPGQDDEARRCLQLQFDALVEEVEALCDKYVPRAWVGEAAGD